MPRTRFWRGFWYAVAIAGVAAMAAGGLGGEAWFARDLVVGLLTFGFFALLVGGIFGATLHGQLRQYAKLRRGEDVLAKWRVDPDTWQAFVQQERLDYWVGNGAQLSERVSHIIRAKKKATAATA